MIDVSLRFVDVMGLWKNPLIFTIFHVARRVAGFVDTTATGKLQALGRRGEREGACSYHVSKQAQKTRESWLLTFWFHLSFK